MKKILFMALSLVFLFACKNPQNGGESSNKTEEFIVNFGAEGEGGTLIAKVKDGEDITSGKKIAKGKEIVFTAKPKDSTYSIESWTLNGKPVAETELKKEKTEYTLKITKEVNVLLKLKKEVKPTSFLSFKSLTINEKTYSNKDDIKQITLEASDQNPVNISGEVNEEGATLSFEKSENEGWIDFTPPLDLKEGDNLSLRMVAKKEGYKTTFFEFKLERKKSAEAIVIKKVEVDGNEVENGGNIEVEKLDAKVKLEITLKQNYENISFKINEESITPNFDTSGMIATFSDFALTKDGLLQVKIKASAPNFTDCEKTITIKHKTPVASVAYITDVAITPWDSEDGGYNYPEDLTKENGNWKGSLSDEGPHQFTVGIDTRDKDITDVTKFTLYMKDANSDKVYFDKITGNKKGEKRIVFERHQDTLGYEILLPTGTTTLDVKLYYGEEVVESCQFIVKR